MKKRLISLFVLLVAAILIVAPSAKDEVCGRCKEEKEYKTYALDNKGLVKVNLCEECEKHIIVRYPVSAHEEL